jgi:hypothetical protein
MKINQLVFPLLIVFLLISLPALAQIQITTDRSTYTSGEDMFVGHMFRNNTGAQSGHYTKEATVTYSLQLVGTEYPDTTMPFSVKIDGEKKMTVDRVVFTNTSEFSQEKVYPYGSSRLGKGPGFDMTINFMSGYESLFGPTTVVEKTNGEQYMLSSSETFKIQTSGVYELRIVMENMEVMASDWPLNDMKLVYIDAL